MGLKVCSLSSGSSGNCIFVASDKTRIIIDAGIPASKIMRSLKALPGEGGVSVLVTHSHSDHVSGLSAFAKISNATVYAEKLPESVFKCGRFDSSEFGLKPFSIGDIDIEPFRVPHDVPCLGFTLRNGDKTLSVVTDLGEASEEVVNRLTFSDMVILESNYDEGMLRSGPYPHYLKKRVLSSYGHLSNDACAEVCTKIVFGKVKQIILAHLSRQNNSPSLAFNNVRDKLNKIGVTEGKDVKIEVAPAFSAGGLYEIF